MIPPQILETDTVEIHLRNTWIIGIFCFITFFFIAVITPVGLFEDSLVMTAHFIGVCYSVGFGLMTIITLFQWCHTKGNFQIGDKIYKWESLEEKDMWEIFHVEHK